MTGNATRPDRHAASTAERQQELAMQNWDLPLVEEVISAPEPQDAFQRFSTLRHVLYLDSAQQLGSLGRYSYLAADPFEFQITCHRELSPGVPHAFAALARHMATLPARTVPGLPPFQGGAAGMFAYDLAHHLERIPWARHDEFQVPLAALGLYDVVVAFDHVTGQCWIVSQGFPATDPAERQARARQRLEFFRQLLTSETKLPSRPANHGASAIPESLLARQHSIAKWPGVSSDFSPEGFMQAVARGIEYVHAGDVFQVNLSQRLLCRATTDSVELYLRLRKENAATFAGYFDLGEMQIVSASPERFLKVTGGIVEARPIKGTRPKTGIPEIDMYGRDDLRGSEKDRAENIMIVDLLRNDLSRSCTIDSIQVPQLCEIESYRYVHHLVSSIEGQLRPGATALDLLTDAFPGGSVTGAPKIRAMEIISELEPTVRGPYCGALGFIGFDGSMDTSILIRTIIAGRGWWQAPVGAGIVARSVPRLEWEETWHKAEGLLRAMRQ